MFHHRLQSTDELRQAGPEELGRYRAWLKETAARIDDDRALVAAERAGILEVRTDGERLASHWAGQHDLADVREQIDQAPDRGLTQESEHDR